MWHGPISQGKFRDPMGAHFTSDMGMGVPKTRGSPYYSYTGTTDCLTPCCACAAWQLQCSEAISISTTDGSNH